MSNSPTRFACRALEEKRGEVTTAIHALIGVRNLRTLSADDRKHIQEHMPEVQALLMQWKEMNTQIMLAAENVGTTRAQLPPTTSVVSAKKPHPKKKKVAEVQ